MPWKISSSIILLIIILGLGGFFVWQRFFRPSPLNKGEGEEIMISEGTKPEVLPSDQMRFGEWKKKYAQGEVLSRDTGAARFQPNH